MNKLYVVNLNNIMLYASCLVPISLLTGPFLADFLVSLVSLIFIALSISEGLKKYYTNLFFYFFFSFYIYLNFNSLFSIEITHSFETSIFYFRYFIFSLALWYLLDTNSKFLKYFFIFFLATFFIAIVDGYIQFFFNTNIVQIDNNDASRLNLTFNEKLLLGGYISRLFPLALALIVFFLPRQKKYYYLIGVLFIITDILVYISGERTALALMILSNIFIIVFMTNFKAIRIITLFISIILIAVISIFNPVIKERNIDHTLVQLDANDSDSIYNLLSPEHESLFTTSYNIFIDKKIIGAGVNTFRFNCINDKYRVDDNSCSTHPHNTYLQVISELGLIGGMFIILSIFYFTKQLSLHFIRLFTNNPKIFTDYQICLIGSFFLTLWPFLPTQNFFNNWINIVYFLPLGFYMHSVYSTKIDNKLEN